MKTYLFILTLLLITSQSFTQEVKNVDYISPMHEDMIRRKKRR